MTATDGGGLSAASGFALQVNSAVITGTSGIDVLTGSAINDMIYGLGGNDTLNGGAGNDLLDGGTGTDKLYGGMGDDTYVVDVATDVVSENANEGTDTVQSKVTYTLSANLDNLTLTGTAKINGTGNTLNNVLTGNSAANTLTGGAGNDRIDGKGGADKMSGGTGDDTYVVDMSTDTVTENANEGIDTVESGITYTLRTNVEALLLTGSSAINGTDNTLNNLLIGNSGINTLTAGTGNDVLQGGAGNDILKDTAGNNLLDGGAGTDTLTGNTGKELFIGGAGNDTITTSTGADIIAFNRGDGQDTVVASTGADNTLSLGGGIGYQNLAMSKSGTNLVLATGNGDQITMQNWFSSTSNRSVINLQIVLDNMTYNPNSLDTLVNRQVQKFDFAALANGFDQALAANPTLTAWNLTDSMLSAHLAGSDTEALGGDLAYQYNLNGSLSGIGVASAQAVLGDANFGVAPQLLHPLAGLQVGAARLG